MMLGDPVTLVAEPVRQARQFDRVAEFVDALTSVPSVRGYVRLLPDTFKYPNLWHRSTRTTLAYGYDGVPLEAARAFVCPLL